jgi:hypothetical protein
MSIAIEWNVRIVPEFSVVVAAETEFLITQSEI